MCSIKVLQHNLTTIAGLKLFFLPNLLTWCRQCHPGEKEFMFLRSVSNVKRCRELEKLTLCTQSGYKRIASSLEINFCLCEIQKTFIFMCQKYSLMKWIIILMSWIITSLRFKYNITYLVKYYEVINYLWHKKDLHTDTS